MPDLVEKLALYRTMLRIRLCEEELARAHQQGLVHGACHTYVGQEAIAAGVCAHLRTSDVIFSTHRGHGHALAKGVSPRELMAELFGRATGCSSGRGGSMHLFQPEVGLMGTTGIVGPNLLQAAGGGYSFRVLGQDNVAVAFFGDGAVNNGAFHEALNMASIWRLPVLFVCENNQFATEVPFEYSAGNPSVAARGTAYGLPGIEVDGNDVLAVYDAAGQAVARARAGQGATLLECKTYRTRAHAEGMGDFTYRTREDVEQWKTRCPIAALKSVLLQDAPDAQPQFDQIEAELRSEIADARQFAEGSPWPEPATAATHIFAVPRDIPSGAALPMATERIVTYTQAVWEALAEEMVVNDRIFVLGEGIGKRGGNFQTTAGLYDKHGPLRLCDTPICERGFIGLACGAAMTGSRPVVDFMFADFILDAVGELVNQIAKMQYMSSGRLKMPILLRGCIGVGHAAATHHSGSYYALFAQAPGLRIVVPSNPYDAKGLLKHALRCDDPVVLLEHRELLTAKGNVPEGDYELPFGVARLVRPGRHATVVALARMVALAEQAAERLAAQGVEIELIDPRTVAPLDVATVLESVRKTGRLLIVDEAPGMCGVGGEIAAEVLAAGFDSLDAPIQRLNGVATPTPYSPPLEAAVVPGIQDIVRAIRELLAQ